MKLCLKFALTSSIALLLAGCGIPPEETGTIYNIPSGPSEGTTYYVPVNGGVSSGGATYNVPVNGGGSSSGTTYNVNS